MAKLTNYSKTQRILLLIDLNPLLQNPNPNPNSYLNSILTASKILLSFPPLSPSLFAFKFFFSSLSPLRSSSALHNLSPSVSFDLPAQTLTSLSQTLNSISIPSFSDAHSPSKASNTASSLLQLMHDYAWDSDFDNLPPGMNHHHHTSYYPPVIPWNLVVLFSPLCNSLKCLPDFFDTDSTTESLSVELYNTFGVVNDRFMSRDIHVSWVDVNYEKEVNESVKQQLELVEGVIRSLGWGFSSTDSIVLGSALVPFGLIYPLIGARLRDLNDSDFNDGVRGQLSLEISDVNGKPLECKCCDMELLNMKVTSADNVDGLEFKHSCGVGQNFWAQFSDGVVTLRVKTVQRCVVEGANCAQRPCHEFLVRPISAESGRSRKKGNKEFFADRVLEQLSRGTTATVPTNFIPIWHILLSFLYKEGCWASVSILKGNREVHTGFLKPFTAHLALLSIVDNYTVIPENISGLKQDKMDGMPSKLGVDVNNLVRSVGSKIGASPVDVKRKKIKKHLLQDLNWNTFCTAAFDLSDLDLAEIYFTGDLSKSKKLKFVKCWMRQIKMSSCSNHIIPDKSKSHQHINKEIDKILTRTPQQIEQPICGQMLSEHSGVQEGAALVSNIDTAETFFYNLPKKIEDGIETEGVDLQILAQRLVNSSIHWLCERQRKGNSLEDQTPNLTISCDYALGTELIALLLKEPKELKKQIDNRTSLQASVRCFTSEHIVREYELQILLRMEILQSEVGGTLVELTIRKIVKQICSLLEITQYLIDGGVHGHGSLYDYAERTIKSRYSHNLEDVVQKIYAQMDLLPFGEEDEPQLLLLNSEDSNQSWREKQELHEMVDTKDIHRSFSFERESSTPLEIVDESPEGTSKEEHDLKLSEARKRREQARRFVSFTSWVPDLQRVWAPKQPKAGIMKSQIPAKEPARKERRRDNYTVVCETPIAGQKRPYSRGRKKDDEDFHDQGNSSSNSVSKALFQDDQ